jgi:hypothetical protein
MRALRIDDGMVNLFFIHEMIFKNKKQVNIC